MQTQEEASRSIAVQLAQRLRKDFGHDLRSDAVLVWLTRAVSEIRSDAYEAGLIEHDRVAYGRLPRG